MKRKVLIIHGEISASAPPDELDTLVQVEAVQAALESLGYVVERCAVGLNLEAFRERLLMVRPDCVFNLVETLGGLMRLTSCAPAVVEAFGIPLTGCSSESLALTTDKCSAKEYLYALGLPTAPWYHPRRPSSLPVEFPSRVIVKSVHEDGSIGLTDQSVQTYGDEQALRTSLREHVKRLGGDWFAESFLDGREFNVGLLETRQGDSSGPRVLPIAEIEFSEFPEGKPRIVGYDAKWKDGSFEALHTVHRTEFSDVDRALLRELEQISIKTFNVLRLSGYARVDFRVLPDGTPMVLEVNANPCIAPDAGFTKAARRAGFSYPALIAALVEAAFYGR